jgi:hypothetical protein
LSKGIFKKNDTAFTETILFPFSLNKRLEMPKIKGRSPRAMSESNRWETLKALMEQEAGLVALFNRDEATLRGSLHKKDWYSVEKSIIRLQEYAGEIERIEKKRHLMWEEIRVEFRLHSEVNFTRSLSVLPLPLREDLNRLYQELRRETISSRSKLEGLRKIAESRTAMIRGVLEDLIPDTRGNCYGRQGLPTPAVSGSLLLNTCL